MPAQWGNAQSKGRQFAAASPCFTFLYLNGKCEQFSLSLFNNLFRVQILAKCRHLNDFITYFILSVESGSSHWLWLFQQPWRQLAGLHTVVFWINHSGDSVPLRRVRVFNARYKFHAKMNPPASLCCSLHQRRLHDGDATANPRPEPGGDPGPLQRWAADARDHGGLYDYAQKDLQICVRRRPEKIRGVDGRVWVCVKRIYSGG